ncbi:hypothetical protein OESDEN_13321 [Oesophagostomum dentatum]|uniref:Uncharacterized protein n=1 Tax=Oesophagostomum dentatum TaxID=61180 RepID=A0A0B1SSP0_OESDE|nr:hypothetical protein OESDEN_13321 [Oesophagostomum dentatum]
MGYPGTSRAMEYCSLFHGYLKVIEDKTVDDGFIEAYSTEHQGFWIEDAAGPTGGSWCPCCNIICKISRW